MFGIILRTSSVYPSSFFFSQDSNCSPTAKKTKQRIEKKIQSLLIVLRSLPIKHYFSSGGSKDTTEVEFSRHLADVHLY